MITKPLTVASKSVLKPNKNMKRDKKLAIGYWKLKKKKTLNIHVMACTAKRGGLIGSNTVHHTSQ